MADDSTIIEGTVKFRDGKKWKTRWCVMRKLSPVADCVQLQLYRDWRARWAGASKASLSLQHFVGAEAGFTLDKHAHTLALLCRDLVAVLAFDSRERLLQWQAKVSAHVGCARVYGVALAAGARRPGPARLLVLRGRAALAQGAPPRLLGVWDLAHLRRYGVVQNRFCFEGGSQCGKGEGLHLLITDQAQEIARDFDLASRGRLSPRRRSFDTKTSDGGESLVRSREGFEPGARPAELNVAAPSPPPPGREEAGAASPYWEPRDGADLALGDTASVRDGAGGAWDGADGAGLQRCLSCMAKLGALSRSSTAALTPGAELFSPAWTMDAAPPAPPAPPAPVEALPPASVALVEETVASGVGGPYENYDVPKVPSAEVEGEYYDTPKRLKDCLNNEIFRLTNGSTESSVILKKPCGCLLRVERRARPLVPATALGACACARVAQWARALLPSCRRPAPPAPPAAPAPAPAPAQAYSALYATIDLSRKTRRKLQPDDNQREPSAAAQVDDAPQAHYENLDFALSLEHYENAKDLLRKAGVTQAELAAIGADPRPSCLTAVADRKLCAKCGHRPPRGGADEAERRSPVGADDDYLMMEPSVGGDRFDNAKSLPAGYAPMSPIGNFGSLAPSRPVRPPRPAPHRALGEKSASNPALGGAGGGGGGGGGGGERPDEAGGGGRERYRKRSSSADSSRFLDDVKEFEGGGSAGSSSSIETLRDTTAATPCDRAADCERAGAAEARRSAAPGEAAGNRDSSSSNDSGVSSCSAGAARGFPGRRCRSTDVAVHRAPVPRKSSSAEAEVPLLSVLSLRGVADARSTSSGTSDMSDYIETLSICSSHSSSDTPVAVRGGRQTSTLRPRSGREYRPARAACGRGQGGRPEGGRPEGGWRPTGGASVELDYT